MKSQLEIYICIFVCRLIVFRWRRENMFVRVWMTIFQWTKKSAVICFFFWVCVFVCAWVRLFVRVNQPLIIKTTVVHQTMIKNFKTFLANSFTKYFPENKLHKKLHSFSLSLLGWNNSEKLKFKYSWLPLQGTIEIYFVLRKIFYIQYMYN